MEKKKSFIIDYRKWKANCEIRVKSIIEPGKRSRHPDFEDAAPVARDKFVITAYVNGKLADSEETYSEGKLPEILESVERKVRATAQTHLESYDIVTTDQKLKSMGYE